MGRISVRTGAGKFFKKCGDIMLLKTATHFQIAYQVLAATLY
jgi:hypothetical protein